MTLDLSAIRREVRAAVPEVSDDRIDWAPGHPLLWYVCHVAGKARCVTAEVERVSPWLGVRFTRAAVEVAAEIVRELRK